ncbi:MAG TPA: TolC family protein [Bryobacteraceae bacterium]|nr:TolC family protein [Bryobacteraceae bacterium]
MCKLEVLAVVLLAPGLGAANLTLRDSVEAALRSYPSIRVSEQQSQAAAAGISLARTAYLPRIDGIAQANRATRNNVTGLLLPQSAIPSISGPVLGTNNLETVWGSAVGALVSWEPFDFGARSARVAAAQAAHRRAEISVERSRFEVAVAAADAFLTMAAAQETVRAADAAVARAKALLRTTSAAVNAQLRPGADAARAEAELAAARTQLIQAQQAVEVARSSIAQYTGISPSAISLAAGRMLTDTPNAPAAGVTPNANPLAREQNAAADEAAAELKALQRTYFPRFAFQASAYARGTGAEPTGRNLGGLNGLAPNTQNYALGLSVTFPFFDFAATRAREAAQSATLGAERARHAQVTTELGARANAALAGLQGARRVAANTPTQVASARAVLSQATARYEAGLAGVVDVAEAQRLLTQAEIDDALARLGAWRALLALEAVRGDIEPFLAEASR